jgi:hypothetical protein
MGVGMFPVFQPYVEGTVFDSDGKLLAAELYRLDASCVQLGVPKLSTFTDNREPPPGFRLDADTDPDELELLMGEWNEWFDPEAAIPTLEALIATLAAGKEFTLQPRESDALVSDLREILSSLRLAAAAGATFRFDII